MSTDTGKADLVFDDRGFGTDERRIPWNDVVAVGLRTTADGPFDEDLYWQFLLRDRVLELPGVLVDGAAMGVLEKHLPGMDSRKIVEAMTSTEERIYRVWHVEESRSAWNDEVFGRRFAALVGQIGGRVSAASEAFDRLRTAWGADGRRYHDREHLADCLRELDLAHAEPALAGIAELALWYHDAVYEPRARDCEERSAQLLITDAAAMQIPREMSQAAAECVRATAHAEPSRQRGPAADLVMDVDLSILGRDVLRFMEFEYSVAEEYASVPTISYRIARGGFLASLLAAPSIFRTEHFRDRCEARARMQIAALLRSPRYRSYRWLRWLWR